MEPILGEGGFITPPAEYLKIAARIVHEYGGACSSSTKCRPASAAPARCSASNITPASQPDIMTMAKGIAAGFPLGAFTATAEIAAAMKPGDHLSTFGGNPIACGCRPCQHRSLARGEALSKTRPRAVRN